MASWPRERRYVCQIRRRKNDVRMSVTLHSETSPGLGHWPREHGPAKTSGSADSSSRRHWGSQAGASVGVRAWISGIRWGRPRTARAQRPLSLRATVPEPSTQNTAWKDQTLKCSRILGECASTLPPPAAGVGRLLRRVGDAIANLESRGNWFMCPATRRQAPPQMVRIVPSQGLV